MNRMRRVLLRISSIILTIIFIVNFTCISINAEVIDKYQEVIIKDIGIEDKEIYYPDGQTKAYIEIENKDYIECIYLNYVNLHNKANIDVTLEYNEENNRFEAEIYSEEFDDTENMNKYELQYIEVITVQDIIKLDKLSISDMGFNGYALDYIVKKDTSSINNINSISIENNNLIYEKDKLKVQVDIDNPEYIEEIIINYQCDYKFEEIYLEYNSISNKFESESDLKCCSKHKFNYISIKSKYENTILDRESIKIKYNIDANLLDFNVSHWKPIINDVKINRNNIITNVGDNKVNITANIENYYEVSSVIIAYIPKNEVNSIDYYCNTGDSDVSQGDTDYIELFYNKESRLFEGTYNLDKSQSRYMNSKSIYKIIIQNIYDSSVEVNRNNLFDYNIEVDKLDITVESYKPISINVDKDQVNKGEYINLNLNLSNYPKEISEVEVKYNENYGSESKRIKLGLSEIDSKIYEGKYLVGDFTESGERKISSIDIKNEDGTICTLISNNSNVIGENIDLSSGDFTIINNINALLYPIRVYSNKNIGKLNSKIQIIVDKIQVNVDSVKIVYLNTKTGKEKMIYMNNNNNKWSGDIDITSDYDEGVWIIDTMIIGQHVDDRYEEVSIKNRYLYWNSIYNCDFRNADIEIVNESIDIEKPDEPKIITIINNKTSLIEGSAEPNSTIVLEKEVKIFGGVKIEEVTRAIADENGKFTINIPAQKVGTSIGIKSIDKAGNISEYTNIIVKNINREDVNFDDVIDIIDIALVGRQYNSMNGDTEWDFDLDVNEDGIVDIFDISMISRRME